jgi:hypothetical protein
MMTLNEMTYTIKKIIENGECICFECMDCGEKVFHYEGSIPLLYNRKYLRGCSFCGGKYKVYGYSGPESDL